jgi:glutaredoxin
MHFLLTLTLLFSFTAFCGSATADMYKWVDENGVVHFSDQPPADSSSTDIEVLRTQKHKPPVKSANDNTPGAVSSENQNVREERPTQTGRAQRVELFTTSWCGYCKMAKQFFRQRGIAFVEYDIEKDASAAARKQKLDSRRGVPFALINGVKVHGYSEMAYQRALYGQ